MRFLRRQTLNRRAVYDNTLYVDTNKSVIMDSRSALKLPSGWGDVNSPPGDPANERPVVPLEGMIRYNNDTQDVEVYQGATWRALRYKEAGAIVQQTVGVGDGQNIYFGPLEPEPPAISQYGYNWSGANLLVIVENVIQLHQTNYTIEQNPTLIAEVYTGKTSASFNINDTTIYFNESIQITGASGSGTTATLTFTSRSKPPFSVGETVVIAGVEPYAYNGKATITACTTNSVSYLSSATGSMTVAGTVTSDHTVWPSIDIVGATVTGSNVPASTHVVSYTIDQDTGALESITVNHPLLGLTASGSNIIINQTSQPETGYYLLFSSPVPPGKQVTVLHGFDS